MAGRARRVLAGVAILAALLAGCSSDDDTISLPTSESTTSSSRPGATTDAPTTTTDASVETSATKPELVIPTEWESDLDEIFGRYLLFWEAEQIALGPPAADPEYSPLREFLTERPYEDVVARLRQYQAANVVSVVPEDSLNDHILRLPNPATLGKSEGSEVIIQDCWIQDTEQQDPDGAVIESVLQSVLFNVTMRVESGEWRVAAITPASDESSGYQECADYVEYLDSPPPCPQCWPYGQQ